MSSETRLDRLLSLLDNGSTQEHRRMAAENIGVLIRNHPYDLQQILVRVHNFLRSNSFNTRFAAGFAFGAIAKNVTLWSPDTAIAEERTKEEEEAKKDELTSLAGGMLSFETFDLHRILTYGKLLLKDKGIEYNDGDLEMLTPEERQRELRRRITEQLRRMTEDNVDTHGHGVKLESLITEDDIAPINYKRKASQVVVDQEEVEKLNSLLQGKSQREAMMIKKKWSLSSKKPKMLASTVTTTTSTAASSRTTVVTEQSNNDKVVVESKLDPDAIFSKSTEWPFLARCEDMCIDLFSPYWQLRHGAAVGLREILKKHGKCAGFMQDGSNTEEEMRTLNARWLEDMAIRLICVIILDRYADMSSFQTVAPVREMVAQALGVTVLNMNDESIKKVLLTLFTLGKCEGWEVRQGSLLGVKYFVVTGGNLVDKMLNQILDVVIQGLQDEEDDVRACAGDVLLPIMDKVISLAPEYVQKITTLLWDALPHLTDISASTECILTLLTGFISSLTNRNPQLISKTHKSNEPLETLIGRLWPFFRHSSRTIRALVTSSVCGMLDNIGAVNLQDVLQSILANTLVISFQNILIEEDEGVAALSIKLWESCINNADGSMLAQALPAKQIVKFFNLVVTKLGIPLKAKNLLSYKYEDGQSDTSLSNADAAIYMAGSKEKHNPTLTLLARLKAAMALGKFTAKIMAANSTNDVILSLVHSAISKTISGKENDNDSSRKLIASFLIAQFSYDMRLIHKFDVASFQHDKFAGTLNIIFGELVVPTSERQLLADFISNREEMKVMCSRILNNYNLNGISLDTLSVLGSVNDFTIQSMEAFLGTSIGQLNSMLINPQAGISSRQPFIDDLHVSLDMYHSLQNEMDLILDAGYCSAVIASCLAPPDISILLNPLFRSLSEERRELVQIQMAKALTFLLHFLVTQQHPSTPLVVKVVEDVIRLVCEDYFFCPSKQFVPVCDSNEEILSLYWNNEQENREQRRENAKKQNNLSEEELIAAKEIDLELENVSQQNERGKLLRKSATSVMLQIVDFFGADTLLQLPFLLDPHEMVLKELMAPLMSGQTLPEVNIRRYQDIINSLSVLQLVLPLLPIACVSRVKRVFSFVIAAVRFPIAGVRYCAASLLAALAKVEHLRSLVMLQIIQCVLPLLGDSTNVTHRRGAAEVCSLLTTELGLSLLPYIVILVIPIMGRMSDFDVLVRKQVTMTFGTLVRLLPLEKDCLEPSDFPETLNAQKEKQREFLDQLLDPSKLSRYAMPVHLKAELRSYQQTGLDWLHFLNKYKLHGVLCDDMGLGKTLQTICIIAADKHERAQAFGRTGSDEYKPLPSLIICPAILVTHWKSEVQKFVDDVSVLMYYGKPNERRGLVPQIHAHDIIVTSYDIARTDRSYLNSTHYNYCVLDEGHVIRNSKSKQTQAIKTYQANHRLILTGTPIQNNSLELWSLFDFLMPGFLGTERDFTARYAKPITASRKVKVNSKHDARDEDITSREKRIHEAATMALENLHRQVLPFLLRRMKEDVLGDLPPKIIQDYTCIMPDIQRQLYDEFVRKTQVASMMKKEEALARKKQDNRVETIAAIGDDETVNDESVTTGGLHIFQALKIMQSICNHPLLLRPSDIPKKVAAVVKTHDWRKPAHVAKLSALQQLLLDCGIGVTEDILATDAISPHRALLFASNKEYLRFIAKDLFDVHMPAVSYLVLDGDVPTLERPFIVEKFTNDPTIDVLLLTKKIGGLGLNLTCADTVIFMEHSWNPQVDSQAMDRVYRIGQDKPVNVYRLICTNTIEEKIMSLQKFKMQMANQIVDSENSSLLSMGTDQLLDLFSPTPTTSTSGEKVGEAGEKPSSSLHRMLEEADKLEFDYDNSEYSVHAFLQNINKEKKM
eukprot:m.130657 g.130657  ORF g.130657 m.130657 type:complete len:1876 (-) comp9471_c0_seq1:289-5916(-)